MTLSPGRLGIFILITIGFGPMGNAGEIPIPLPLPSFRNNPVMNQDKVIAQNEIKKPEREKNPTLTKIRQGVKVITRLYPDHVAEIKIKWASSVGCALYQRGNRATIAFDHPALFHLDQAAQLENTFYNDMRQVFDRPDLSGFSFSVIPDKSMTLYKSGDEWIIRLEKGATEGRPPVLLSPYATDTPSLRLKYKLPDITNLGQATDPDLGDRIFMAFSNRVQPARGREYADYITLQTQTGIVLASRIDDLETNRDEKGFEVFRSGKKPLHLSPIEDRNRERHLPFPAHILDFSKWNDVRKKELDTERLLIQSIIHGEGEMRLRTRQQLALFYLALGKFSEASTQTSLMEQENPRIADDIAYLALKAISHVLSCQPDRAQAIFEMPVFGDEPEILFWKGVARLVDENYYEGLQLLIPNIRYLKNYPTKIRNFVALRAAQASCELDYPGKIFLDAINKKELEPYEIELYDLYATQLRRPPEKDRQYTAQLKALSLSRHPRAKTEGTLLLMQEENTPAMEEIRILEPLRYLWRGDDTEIAIMERLSDLYRKNGKPEKALNYLRQLNEYFAGHSSHDNIARKGQNLFYQLFMDGDTLDLYRRIAFYQEFREFLPQDDRQYKMMGRLAAMYEAAGFHQKSSEILENLLEQKSVPEKIVSGVLLHQAKNYLKQKKYDAVKTTLDKITPEMEKNPHIREKKIFLGAMVLSNQNRMEEALNVLKSIEGLESLKTQAEICWQNQSWNKAAGYLARIIKDMAPADPQRPPYLLRLAVAMAHGKNMNGLENLKETFGPFMQKTEFGDAFMIITSSTNGKDGSLWQDSLEKLSNTRNFKEFLENFRQKYPIESKTNK